MPSFSFTQASVYNEGPLNVAVKIRLMRVGKKKQPTYRVVVADARSPRDGRFIEIIGQYEPRQEPSRITLDHDKALSWIEKGAQPTERVAKILEVEGVWNAYQTKHGKPAGTKPTAKTPKAKQVKAEAGAE
jgi:small subunit ribosomal protein S16